MGPPTPTKYAPSIWLIAASAIALFAMVFFFERGFERRGSVYFWDSGHWTPAGARQESANSITSGMDGTVWIQYSTSGSLDHIVNGIPRTASETKFKLSLFSTAIHKGHLWGAQREGLVSFDPALLKGHWQKHPGGAEVFQMASNGSTLWMLDRAGKLWSSDKPEQAAWTPESMPPVSGHRWDIAFRQGLIADADGTVWLAASDAVWTRDPGDKSWHRFGTLEGAQFCGTGLGSHWFRSKRQMFRTQGAALVQWRPNDYGIPETADLYSIRENTLLGKDALYRINGGKAERLALPPAIAFATIAVSNNAIWLAGTEALSLPAMPRMLIYAAALILVLGVLVALSFRQMVKTGQLRSSREAESIETVVGKEKVEAAREQAKQGRAATLLGIVVIAVAAMAVLKFGRQSELPAGTFGFAVLVLMFFVVWLSYHRRRGVTLAQAARRALLGLPFCLFLVFQHDILDVLFSAVPNRYLALIGAVLLLALLLPLSILSANGPYALGALWIKMALRKGLYGVALHRARRLVSWFPDDPYVQSLLGTVLLDAGQPDEAAQVCRQTAEQYTGLPGEPASLCIAILGAAIAELGDVEGGLKALAAAQGSQTAHPIAMKQRAALLLSIGKPDQALECADAALAFYAKQGAIVARLSKDGIVEAQALRAWALALLGRDSEARQQIARALALSSPDDLGSQAEVHYLAGRTSQALGSLHEAVRHWSKVPELAPGSRSEKLARRALQSLDS